MIGVRVLLVEDEGMSAAMAVTELTETMSCEVTVVADPIEALVRLGREHFDVTVVDMLYLKHSEEFEKRRRRGEVRLTDARLHLSGLAVLPAVAFWTWHYRWEGIPPIGRVVFLAMALVPAYLLFATGLML